MCLGREFKRDEAVMEKALPSQVWCLVLTAVDRRLESGDLSLQDGE